MRQTFILHVPIIFCSDKFSCESKPDQEVQQQQWKMPVMAQKRIWVLRRLLKVFMSLLYWLHTKTKQRRNEKFTITLFSTDHDVMIRVGSTDPNPTNQCVPAAESTEQSEHLLSEEKRTIRL